MNNKTAVILAGGKGTRLRPYTVALPKPLVPVGDKPILEIIIISLAKQGFKRVIITVNHQAEIIMAYFGNGGKWNISIEYSLEKEPLGTMGPLCLIENLPNDFLVMNGDVLTDINFALLLKNHMQSANIFTISCHKRVQKSDYGVLEIKDSLLAGFKEKPETSFMVSMGVYAVSRSILKYIPYMQYFGFDSLMNVLLDSNVNVGIYEHNGYWMDIGRPDDYQQAVDDIDSGTFIY